MSILFLLLFSFVLSTPQCSWMCDDPVCPAICEPLCEETACQLFPQGYAQFARPDCETRCNTTGADPSQECPRCETVCKAPRCSPHCQIQCGPPRCAWQCRKPECPHPRCELQCEMAACSIPGEPLPIIETTTTLPTTAIATSTNNGARNEIQETIVFILIVLLWINT